MYDIVEVLRGDKRRSISKGVPPVSLTRNRDISPEPLPSEGRKRKRMSLVVSLKRLDATPRTPRDIVSDDIPISKKKRRKIVVSSSS